MDFLRTVCGDSPVFYRTFAPTRGSGHNFTDDSQLKKENKTRGVYFVVNSGGQSDADITKFNAVFCEVDNLPLADQHKLYNNCPLAPSIRVETKKSVHAYWLLEPGATEAEWRRAQQGLIEYFKSDPAIKNPSRVMRVPGYDHIDKQGKRKQVICAHLTDARYPIETILRIFKPTKLTGLLNATPGVNVNNSMTAEVASLCAHGVAMADTLRLVSALCPGKEDEVLLAVKNIYAKDGRAQRQPDVERMRDRGEPPPVRWLWRGVIPMGMFGAITGMPKAGKTFFALKVIADYTHSQVCHEPKCEPRNVLIFTSADDPKAHTMHRRLRSLGADDKYIHFGTHTDLFLDGVDLFRRYMDKFKPGIVMFDPLHFDSRIDQNSGQEIREFLTKLGLVFCEYEDCAYLPVQHVNKKQDLPGIHRLSGSAVIGQIARWVLEVVKVKGDRNLRGVRVAYLNDGVELENLIGFTLGGTAESPTVEWNDREDLIEHKEGEKISAIEKAEGIVDEIMGKENPAYRDGLNLAKKEGIGERVYQRALRSKGVVTKRVYGKEGVDHCILEWGEI